MIGLVGLIPAGTKLLPLLHASTPPWSPWARPKLQQPQWSCEWDCSVTHTQTHHMNVQGKVILPRLSATWLLLFIDLYFIYKWKKTQSRGCFKPRPTPVRGAVILLFPSWTTLTAFRKQAVCWEVAHLVLCVVLFCDGAVRMWVPEAWQRPTKPYPRTPVGRHTLNK